MILLSLDFETTGIDPANDRVIEVGAALWSTGQHRVLESAGFLVKSDVPISQEITTLTGIHPAAVDRFGYDSHAALENILAMMELAETPIPIFQAKREESSSTCLWTRPDLVLTRFSTRLLRTRCLRLCLWISLIWIRSWSEQNPQ